MNLILDSFILSLHVIVFQIYIIFKYIKNEISHIHRVYILRKFYSNTWIEQDMKYNSSVNSFMNTLRELYKDTLIKQVKIWNIILFMKQSINKIIDQSFINLQ